MIKKTILATALSLFALSSFSAEVSVSKLRVNIEGSQTADFLSLLNQSENKKESFEVKLYKWTQKENLKKDDGTYGVPEEVLDESSAVLVSPKTVVVLPKQEKVIRIILNNSNEAKKDYSYRMVINQLPSKDPDGSEQNVVNLLFKISLPIFVYDDKIKKVEDMKLSHSFIKELKQNILTIHNQDNQHIQIQNLLYGPKLDKKLSINHYILPSNIDKISLPEDFNQQVFNSGFTIETDKGNLTINPSTNNKK